MNRYHWMNENNEMKNRNTFKNVINITHEFLLMPVSIKDKTKPLDQYNLKFYDELSIKMKNAYFTRGDSIGENDPLCFIYHESE